jgi:HK97 family phage major capsid protein
MKDKLALRDDLLHATKSMEDILGKVAEEERAITPEEVEQFDALETRCTELEGEIAAKELEDAELEKRTQSVASRMEKLSTPAERKTAPISTTADGTTPQEPRIQPVTRFGKLKSFKGPDAEKRALVTGHWLRHLVTGDASSKRFLEDHVSEEFRAAGGDNNLKGGALVPIEMSNAIIDLQFEYGIFRQYAQNWPMTGDTLEIPRDSSALTVTFTGEGVEGTETDPAFDVITLTAKKAMAISRYSNELGDDAIISMADLIVNKFARAFAKKEDDCGFNGDGTNSTYGGMIGLNTLFDEDGFGGVVRAGAVAGTTGSILFASFDIDDMSNLMAALPSYALAGAKFFCSSQWNAQVFDNIKATAGGNTTMTLNDRPVPAYMGYPIIVSEVMPSSYTDTECLVLFGDLSMSSAFGARSDIEVDVSKDKYWSTDQIGVRGKERFDIINHDVGDATNAGPVVGMYGKSA